MRRRGGLRKKLRTKLPIAKLLDALRKGKMRDRAVARVLGEGIERELEPEENSHGPPADLSSHGQPLRGGRGQPVEQTSPFLRGAHVLSQRE